MTTTLGNERPHDDISSDRGWIRPDLRLALRLNAAFSTVTGTIAAFAAPSVAEFVGVELAWIVRTVGLGLLVFAVSLILVSRLKDVERLREEALLISIADIGWVLGSIVLIPFGVFTSDGAWLMATLAGGVSILAALQLRARASLRQR